MRKAWMARGVAGLVIALTLLAKPAAAQGRDGFFIGFGLGYGALDLTCDGCDVSREGGLSGYFKIGGAISPRVLLSAETNGWYKSEDGVDVSFGTLAGVVTAYPSATTPFFVRGGLGIGYLSADAGIGGSDSETGLGGTLGLGYDIPIGGSAALTPYANYSIGDFDGFGANVLQFGLGINWY